MSKPRFSLYAEVDTLAHAQTILANVITQLAGKNIFQQHNAFAVIDSFSGKNIFFADRRFNSSVDRDAIRDWIKDQIQNSPQVKVWVNKARLKWHDCTHNDAVVLDCRVTNYSEWSK